ncbi:MAG TPA: porin family protein [Xanthobacteraceae bacterium]|nr:porin family protein [Xanthobacteraceae bacterium]
MVDDYPALRVEDMKGRPMRRVLLVLTGLMLVSPATAADLDLDILHGLQPVGPATFTRWSGFYVGGQIGYSNGNADFSSATRLGLAYALRETTLENEFDVSQWPTLGTANQTLPTFGGFIGYNTQWQDVVVGVEANINRAALTLQAPSTPIGPLITAADSQGYTHSVTISSSGSLTGGDFGSLRARGGYVIGNFMPYGFAGLALSNVSVAVASNVVDNQCTTATPIVCARIPYSNSFNANAQMLYGIAAGGGVDWALTPNIFLRAEVEWDAFNAPPGMLLTMATGRLGAGFKF